MSLVRSEVIERLTAVFRSTFDSDTIELSDGMTAADIDEWDSLMHINLVVHIEKEFSIRLNAAEVGELKNVGEMLNLIGRRSGG